MGAAAILRPTFRVGVLAQAAALLRRDLAAARADRGMLALAHGAGRAVDGHLVAEADRQLGPLEQRAVGLLVVAVVLRERRAPVEAPPAEGRHERLALGAVAMLAAGVEERLRERHGPRALRLDAHGLLRRRQERLHRREWTSEAAQIDDQEARRGCEVDFGAAQIVHES